MKRMLLAAAGVIVGGLFLMAGPAMATTDSGNIYLESKCTNVRAFYVNSDEATRKPDTSPNGLIFTGTDLIHHAVTGDITASLKPGNFTATGSPDQDSFFSIEVFGTDGKYGTLRYNTVQHYWEATSQGQQNHAADALTLADSFPIHLSHHMLSAGVGYTQNPPGTNKVVVSSMVFNGVFYSMTCTGKTGPGSPSQSPSTSPSASTSASPSASHTVLPSESRSNGGVVTSGSKSTPTKGGALAITGPTSETYAALGGGVALIGALVIWFTRRRKATFIA